MCLTSTCLSRLQQLKWSWPSRLCTLSPSTLDQHQCSADTLHIHIVNRKHPGGFHTLPFSMANRRRSRRSPSLPPLPGTHLDGATVLPKGRYPMPSNIQPTNFIRISQVNSVRGVYTIDPGLSPPASMGIPATAGAQKNVVMDSQKGNLNVDLFVLPSSDKRTMVSMTLKSEHGTARVRVVSCIVHPDPRMGAYLK